MRLLRYRHACPVGIDIRAAEIRMVRLAKRSRGKYGIECADIAYLPSRQPGLPDWQALQALLGRMVRTCGLEGQSAVIGLPASGVRMQRLALPGSLQPYAIEAAVQGRLRQEMFGLAGSVCVDYVELGRRAAREQEVYFVAARQELLAQYVECVAAAGLEVKIVDVDVLALQRAVCHLLDGGESSTGIVALMVMIQNTAEWIVYDHQTVLIHHLMDVPERELLASIMEVQVKKSSSIYPQKQLQRIIIYSDGEAFDQVLAEIENIPVQYADLRRWLQIQPEMQRIFLSGNMLTACGLSMRELHPWC